MKQFSTEARPDEAAGTGRVQGKNVILVDGDYVDRVAFDLIVNFERMLGRRIPQADLPQWLDCIALDGGLREGDHQTQVVFIHTKEHAQLENFVPADYEKELNNQAFHDKLGEFAINSYPVESLVEPADFFLDVLQTVCSQQDVERIMVVPDAEHIYNEVRATLRDITPDKHVTVFAMQPMPGGSFRQEILGFSLMAALGIRADEIQPE